MGESILYLSTSKYSLLPCEERRESVKPPTIYRIYRYMNKILKEFRALAEAVGHVQKLAKHADSDSHEDHHPPDNTDADKEGISILNSENEEEEDTENYAWKRNRPSEPHRYKSAWVNFREEHRLGVKAHLSSLAQWGKTVTYHEENTALSEMWEIMDEEARARYVWMGNDEEVPSYSNSNSKPVKGHRKSARTGTDVKHKYELGLECPICSQKFTDKESLKLHLKPGLCVKPALPVQIKKSAYRVFQRENASEMTVRLKAQNRKLPQGGVVLSELAVAWKAMNATAREPYQKMADEENEDSNSNDRDSGSDSDLSGPAPVSDTDAAAAVVVSASVAGLIAPVGNSTDQQHKMEAVFSLLQERDLEKYPGQIFIDDARNVYVMESEYAEFAMTTTNNNAAASTTSKYVPVPLDENGDEIDFHDLYDC